MYVDDERERDLYVKKNTEGSIAGREYKKLLEDDLGVIKKINVASIEKLEALNKCITDLIEERDTLKSINEKLRSQQANTITEESSKFIFYT